MAGPLGKKVAVPDSFSPEILFPISRDNQRKDKHLIFEKGFDIWNLHEVFWLDKDSVTNHDELSIHIPADSKFTVESKSLKLYFQSFRNHQSFHEDVTMLIAKDITKLLKLRFELRLHSKNFYILEHDIIVTIFVILFNCFYCPYFNCILQYFNKP